MKCHACHSEISAGSKICKVCGSNQNIVLFGINGLTGSISVLSLFVAIWSFYNTMKVELIGPKLVVQINQFEKEQFSFFVVNLGDMPTVVRDVRLGISLAEREGKKKLEAFFQIPEVPIEALNSHLFQLKYSDFQPNTVSMNLSGQADKELDVEFMRMAAKLGSNLVCDVQITYTNAQYFPHNFVNSGASVNGVCADAMYWYADFLGVLKLNAE